MVCLDSPPSIILQACFWVLSGTPAMKPTTFQRLRKSWRCGEKHDEHSRIETITPLGLATQGSTKPKCSMYGIFQHTVEFGSFSYPKNWPGKVGVSDFVNSVLENAKTAPTSQQNKSRGTQSKHPTLLLLGPSAAGPSTKSRNPYLLCYPYI